MSEVQTLARRLVWPPTQVKNGVIAVNPGRSLLAPRRRLQIADRRFGVTGRAPGVFLYAPLVRASLQVEEICATGTPIRLVSIPSGVECVDPPGTVVPIPAVVSSSFGRRGI